MFRIGVFSQLTRVSARMLRHYEKCGLLFPAHIDKDKGHRYYTASQIPLVARIITLRDMGFSIEEIGNVLENFDDKNYVEKALLEKDEALKATIAIETKRMQNLQAMQLLMNEKDYKQPYEIVLKSVPKYKVLSLRETIPNYSHQEELWGKLFAFIENNNLRPILSGNVLCVYYNNEYTENEVDMEVSVTVTELRPSEGSFTFKETDEIPLVVTSLFEGFYHNMAIWESVLIKWIEENGYEIIGNERGFGIRNVLNEQAPEKYLTEIQFPIQKTKEN